jgi:hypothetical protein
VPVAHARRLEAGEAVRAGVRALALLFLSDHGSPAGLVGWQFSARLKISLL